MCPPSYPLHCISGSVFGEQRAATECGEGGEMRGYVCVCDTFVGDAE